MRAVVLAGALALAGTATLSAQAPDGKALYLKHCRACHGAQGTPSAAMVKAMKVPTIDQASMAAQSDEAVLGVIKTGKKAMKGFEGKLSPQEMQAMVAYLREMVKPAAGT